MKKNEQVVLSFDIGLDRLDASLSDSNGEWLIGHHPYANNWQGYQELKQDVLAHLANFEEPQLAVVGESTGRYWWHIFSPWGTSKIFAVPYQPEIRMTRTMLI